MPLLFPYKPLAGDERLSAAEVAAFSVRTIIGIILGVSVFIFYVSNVRPVGRFDSLVGLFLGVTILIVVKKFKGITK